LLVGYRYSKLLSSTCVPCSALDIQPLAELDQSLTPSRRLPDCLDDHNAAQSTRIIFSQLVELADESDNGRILVDRRSFINPATDKSYSQRTVYKALQWLIAHRLLMRTSVGTGRGNLSEYFVRWSFDHETLSKRQSEINHRRNKVVTPLPIEESLEPGSVASFEMNKEFEILESSHETANSPSLIWKSSPKTQPKESTQSLKPCSAVRQSLLYIKPLIYSLPNNSEFTDHQDLIDAFAARIYRAAREGQIRNGQDIAAIIDYAHGELTGLDGLPDFAYSFAGMVVRDALAGLPALLWECWEQPGTTPKPQRWQQPSTPPRRNAYLDASPKEPEHRANRADYLAAVNDLN
jgi:hypothetical protein